MTTTLWPFGASAVVPFWIRALNFSLNVFLWEQFKRPLQSTMHFKESSKKEIVGGGANKKSRLQGGDDYIFTHNSITPAAR